MQKLRFKEDYLHGQGHTAWKGQNSNTILSDFKVCILSTYLLINNDYNVQARGDLIWDEVWRWEWLMPGFHLSHLNILAWSFHFNSFKLSEIKIWTLFLLEVWRERVWGSGETRVGAFSGVLELAHTGSWELIVNIFQLCIQRYDIDRLKSVMVGEFKPQKLANTTNQGTFPPLESSC